MLQEDSNGEASFEIIDKKHEESSNNGDKTESISSVSSAYSIPSPSVVNLPGGNLLSNLPPPSTLPDFTLWQSQSTSVSAPTSLPQNLLPPTTTHVVHENKNLPQISKTVNVLPPNEPFIPTQFSAAIPPSKGIQHGPTPQNVSTASQNAGGLIGWMKDAVSSGGILSKVAEKAKSSVDSLITTLDPQMSEFIYSGGDIEITIASQDLEEVVPIREAIYSVFGKAWVNSVNVNLEDKKFQAIGFEEGYKNAEEKINASSQMHKTPIIAVENILLQHNNSWFDLSVLVIKDVEKQITLHTFSQCTPIPDSIVKQAGKEITDKLLAAYLKTCKNTWQQSVGGVSRRETLFMTAKVLVGVYKSKLIVNH